MAEFTLDIHVSGLVAGLLEGAGHRVVRAAHRAEDAAIVEACLAEGTILVTFNRREDMRNAVSQGVPRGLRVFSLPTLNLLRKTTRRRLEREIVESILRYAELPPPYLCAIDLDESRHRIAEVRFLHGGPGAHE